MLKKCTKEELGLYIEFAYELALTIEKSAYPTYCDGVKTKKDFVKQLEAAFDSDTEELLLFEYEGKVEGVIQYYWIPEDNYIGTNCFNINREAKVAMAEFLNLMKEKFKGYELFLGFPEDNREVCDYLEKQGIECIENDYNNTAFLQNIDHIPKINSLVKINKDKYESFKMLHDKIEGDMYWNSERILDDFENWTIFVEEKDEVPVGAVYFTGDSQWYEIFGIDMNNGKYNQKIFKDLLYGALNDVKSKGGKIMTFFCEEEGQKACLECGFTNVGKYRCYKMKLL